MRAAAFWEPCWDPPCSRSSTRRRRRSPRARSTSAPTARRWATRVGALLAATDQDGTGAGLRVAARRERPDRAGLALLPLVTLLQDPGGRLEPAAGTGRGALGYGLAALTYDRVPALAVFAGRADIGFPLLSDEGSKIIAALDLRDPAPAESTPWYGMARPMILAIDAGGVVRQRFSTHGYRDRPEAGAVLEAIRDRGGTR